MNKAFETKIADLDVLDFSNLKMDENEDLLVFAITCDCVPYKVT